LFHSRHLLTEVLVKNDPFTGDQVTALMREAKRLSFDPLWLHGVPGNRAFSTLMTTDGAAHAALLRTTRYVLESVTDQKPFFFRFHRWQRLLDSVDFGPFLAT